MSRLECTFPLQVLRPIYGDSGVPCVTMLTPSGGLLDGDQLDIQVVVHEGAALDLRTQAATQLHAGVSSQRIEVQVAAGGQFRFVPHELTPHAYADFSSSTSISLADSASAVWSECVAPGRTFTGEQFAYERLQLSMDCWYGSKLACRERNVVMPRDFDVRLALGGFSHWLNAYMVGSEPPADSWSASPSERLIGGISQLAAGGECLRAVGCRASDLLGLADVWSRRFPGLPGK